MYNIVRYIIGAVVFVVLIIIIFRSKIKHKIRGSLLAFCIAYILQALSIYLPVENFIIPFDSPEEVCDYMSGPVFSEEYFVVEGKENALAVFTEGTVSNVLKLSRSEQDWNIGLMFGIETFGSMDSLYSCI